MSTLTGRVVAAFFFLASGWALFLVLLGRIVLSRKEGPARKRLTWILLLGITAVSGFLGVSAGVSAWLLIPCGIFFLLALREIQRIVLCRRYAASPPVETHGPAASLRRPLTTYDLVTRMYEVEVPHWPHEGLRVAHISDLHVNEKFRREYYDDVMARVAAVDPDLLLMTGDFVSTPGDIPLLQDVLSRARAPHGVYAILGNHDHWAGTDAIRGVLESTAVTVLGNGWCRAEVRGMKMVLSGCEDPWEVEEWKAPPAVEGEPVFVLSHTADNIYRLNKAGAAAVFAGHYHGGQGALPFWGAVIVPSKYGRRFTHGHFLVDGTHLFVTAGVGAFSPPCRIYCHPEIIVVDFKGEGEGRGKDEGGRMKAEELRGG